MDINREAFIFLTHSHHRDLIKEFNKIETACREYGDAWFLFQGEDRNFKLDHPTQNLERCVLDDLLKCGFASEHPFIIPGNSHFPILWFLRKHPHYRRYWVIEYDCRFSGSWETLFDAFKDQDADLVTSYIHRHAEEPDWGHWRLSHPTQTIPLEARLRCFHPLYRISRPALKFLEKAHTEGWAGHSELLIPTLLHYNKYSLQDFGGDGSFVPVGWENKFYTAPMHGTHGALDLGTLRFRPVHEQIGSLKDKIYHPIKNPETEAGKTIIVPPKNIQPHQQPRSFSIVYSWPASALIKFTQVGRLSEGAIHTTGRAGYLFYGPYMMHPAGDWLLMLRGEFIRMEHAFLDITSVAKECVIHQSNLSMDEIKPNGSLVISYSIASPLRDVEFRLYVSPSDHFSIRDYRILSADTANLEAGAGNLPSDSHQHR